MLGVDARVDECTHEMHACTTDAREIETRSIDAWTRCFVVAFVFVVRAVVVVRAAVAWWWWRRRTEDDDDAVDTCDVSWMSSCRHRADRIDDDDDDDDDAFDDGGAAMSTAATRV